MHDGRRGGGTGGSVQRVCPVSYTHLDVYKRQGMDAPYQLLKWPEAARRIGQLVEDGLYLTDEEQQQLSLIHI